MKRGLHILIISLVLVSTWILTANITEAIIIIGKNITGAATQPIGMNITVTAPPALIILSPENKTYLTNESILLNYSVSGENSVWYNLDNLDNTTITSFLYFNTSEGSHTLYLFADNNQGNTTKSVDFIINITIFVITDDEFEQNEDDGEDNGRMERNPKKGSSTDFLDYSYEDLQNLSNIILEHINYGKISFNEAINLTDDENPSDNILDINSHINISFNRIEINSTALPNFNKSATLQLYNLTFSTPRILKDGAVCPSSICTQNSFSGGILSFNVTESSVYEAEETPTGEAPSMGGGGGGGIITKKDFSVDKERITIKLKQGETKKQEIIIENTGTQKIKLDLSIFNLEEFVRVREEHFELNKSESKTIALDFIASEDASPDLYMGKLIIESDGIEKEILIAIEVESKKPLFDVKVSIPEKFLYVAPGEEIMSEINLYSLGAEGRVDVSLDYMVKNEQGSIIISEQETKAVETETSFIKTLKIPEDTKPGAYIFYVKASYNGEVASASTWFSVGLEKPFFKKGNIFLIIIIIIIIIFIIFLLFVLIELKTLKKYIKTHMKINKDTLVKEGVIKLRR